VDFTALRAAFNLVVSQLKNLAAGTGYFYLHYLFALSEEHDYLLYQAAAVPVSDFSHLNEGEERREEVVG
jgi:hypothetical protein